MFTLRHAFPGQNESEPVFIFVRPHPLSFVPYAAICLIMMVVAVILISGSLAFRDSLSPLFFNIALAASGLFALFAIVFSLIAFIDFYFDIQIVTDRRIIDVNQNRLFNRQLSELNLEDVEDVSVHINGAIPTLFSYGNITIQTAGEQTNFHFINVPHPREIAAVISDLAEQAKRGDENETRIPQGTVKGVISGRTVGSVTDLIRLGVHLTPTTSQNPPLPHV